MRHFLFGMLSLAIAFSAAAQTADPHAGHHQDKTEMARTPLGAEPDRPCPIMDDCMPSVSAGTMSHDRTNPGHHGEHCKAMQTPDHEKGEQK
ncbi:hypothetical protein CAF53_03140 [Sphingobium sp. LB126]|nr:hypothetical protein CAF53_03140 [Sphingobium sp. LB126]